ncbi:MAG TPA: hypothetical protein VGA70_00860 [Longimicrobiales bacterium]
MVESNLPAVPSAVTGPGGSAVAPEDGPPGGAPRGAGRWLRPLAIGLVGALGILLSLAFASLLGPRVRRAVLVEVDVSPVGSEPAFTDAPGEAARFFADRDSVTVRIPWDMTVADFLGLYHLETNPSAREALRTQIGAVADADVLREGDEVTLTLTATRPGSGS